MTVIQLVTHKYVENDRCVLYTTTQTQTDRQTHTHTHTRERERERGGREEYKHVTNSMLSVHTPERDIGM